MGADRYSLCCRSQRQEEATVQGFVRRNKGTGGWGGSFVKVNGRESRCPFRSVWRGGETSSFDLPVRCPGEKKNWLAIPGRKRRRDGTAEFLTRNDRTSVQTRPSVLLVPFPQQMTRVTAKYGGTDSRERSSWLLIGPEWTTFTFSQKVEMVVSTWIPETDDSGAATSGLSPGFNT